MKKILLILLMVIILILLAGCSSKEADRITSAKVRYFDGSQDTILITGYRVREGAVYLDTLSGRRMVFGANNVIIINETEEQYNCQDY